MRRALFLVVMPILIHVGAGLYQFGTAGAQPAPEGPALGKLVEVVLIDPGSFIMGSPPTEAGRQSDEIQHRVAITRPFYIGKYEVTQEQWIKVMGTNPSEFLDCGMKCPVETIGWNDAVEFCNRLSDMEGLGRCYKGSGEKVTWDQACTGYRLPTEAEWEYSARAGTTTSFSCGDQCPSEVAVFAKAPGGSAPDSGPDPAGSKQPNPWGVYDMHGNVWEWVWDWYAPYSNDAQTDPAGPEAGKYKIVRGGGWFSFENNCRSAVRENYLINDLHGFIGLRLARTAQPDQPPIDQ